MRSIFREGFTAGEWSKISRQLQRFRKVKVSRQMETLSLLMEYLEHLKCLKFNSMAAVRLLGFMNDLKERLQQRGLSHEEYLEASLPYHGCLRLKIPMKMKRKFPRAELPLLLIEFLILRSGSMACKTR